VTSQDGKCAELSRLRVVVDGHEDVLISDSDRACLPCGSCRSAHENVLRQDAQHLLERHPALSPSLLEPGSLLPHQATFAGSTMRRSRSS
jgi:cytidine deaminase